MQTRSGIERSGKDRRKVSIENNHASLTVYFENPFWVGVFERVEDGNLSVCKVTFGSEPKDYEIADFVLHHYYDLKFSPTVKAKVKQSADNPKRRQRNAKKQIQNAGIGTKSQQALAFQREELKTERKKISKAEKIAQKQHHFDAKQQKKKEKRKGH